MLRKEGTFTIDGMALEYRLLGPAPGETPTLILLHEGLGCLAMWKDFPQQLALRTGLGVLAYSRAGYGGSSPCPLPRPISFMHDEALTVLPKILDAAGISEAVLVGHSDGASIALIHAGGTADSRLKGLVLMAPHVFVEELTVNSIRAATQAYATTDLRTRLARYHGDNVDCAFSGWSDAWLDPLFLSWNIENYLEGIRVPTLMMQGEEDNYGTAEQLERIARGTPGGAEILLLPDCGHSPHRDQTEATLNAIAGFLAGLNSSFVRLDPAFTLTQKVLEGQLLDI